MEHDIRIASEDVTGSVEWCVQSDGRPLSLLLCGRLGQIEQDLIRCAVQYTQLLVTHNQYRLFGILERIRALGLPLAVVAADSTLSEFTFLCLVAQMRRLNPDDDVAFLSYRNDRLRLFRDGVLLAASRWSSGQHSSALNEAFDQTMRDHNESPVARGADGRLGSPVVVSLPHAQRKLSSARRQWGFLRLVAGM